MAVQLSSFITKRLSLRESGSRRLSPAIAVAIAGIAVAFVVMMLSIAVVYGFKEEITRKIMGFDAQVTVAPLQSQYGDEATPLERSEALDRAVERALKNCDIPSEGVSASLAADETGVLKTATDFLGVNFRAYGEGHDSIFELSTLTEGSLPDEEDARGVVLSQKMVDKLGLSLGDKVDAYFISGESVRPRRFVVRGIYSSGFSDYDDVVAYAPYSTMSRLLKLGDNQGERLEISGLQKDQIDAFARALQSELNRCYATGEISEVLAVDTVLRTGAVYFNWLALLDTNVVVILVLMACVSGFMLITCVLILILQRVNMIGIIKALGASDRQIRAIFLRLGARVIAAGLLIGNIVSLLLIWAEARWHLIPLDPDSYYLTSVPVEITWSAWLALNLGVAALSYALMVIPTSTISRLSPVKTLQWE